MQSKIYCSNNRGSLTNTTDGAKHATKISFCLMLRSCTISVFIFADECVQLFKPFTSCAYTKDLNARRTE